MEPKMYMNEAQTVLFKAPNRTAQ